MGYIMKFFLKIVVAAITISSLVSNAHSGRTDKKGCHHDKKAGTYHCH
jgi:hypothetical protein